MKDNKMNWKILFPFLVVWISTVVCMSAYFAHFFGNMSWIVFSVLSILGSVAGNFVVILGKDRITSRHLLILLGISFVSFFFAYALPSGGDLLRAFILPALDSLRY